MKFKHKLKNHNVVQYILGSIKSRIRGGIKQNRVNSEMSQLFTSYKSRYMLIMLIIII
jgi:hypothetical protein